MKGRFLFELPADRAKYLVEKGLEPREKGESNRPFHEICVLFFLSVLGSFYSIHDGSFNFFHALDGGMISHPVHMGESNGDHGISIAGFQHALGDLRFQTAVYKTVDLGFGKEFP